METKTKLLEQMFDFEIDADSFYPKMFDFEVDADSFYPKMFDFEVDAIPDPEKFGRGEDKNGN